MERLKKPIACKLIYCFFLFLIWGSTQQISAQTEHRVYELYYLPFIAKVKQNLITWESQPRGYPNCTPATVEILLTSQTNDVVAVCLSNLWEELQLVWTNPAKGPLWEHDADEFRALNIVWKNIEGGTKGQLWEHMAVKIQSACNSQPLSFSPQIIEDAFTMLACLPVSTFDVTNAVRNNNLEYAIPKKWHLLGYLGGIKSQSACLGYASLLGDIRQNIMSDYVPPENVPNKYHFDLEHFPKDTVEPFLRLYDWNKRMGLYQRELNLISRNAFTSMKNMCVDVAYRMATEERKVFLDKIKELARLNEEELEFLEALFE